MFTSSSTVLYTPNVPLGLPYLLVETVIYDLESVVLQHDEESLTSPYRTPILPYPVSRLGSCMWTDY
jgi:hypothetical protein